MGKKSEEPVFTKEQEILKENYKQFTKNAIFNLIDYNRNTSTEEIIDLTNFLKDNRDIIEAPLYDTCKVYYIEGCNSTQVGFLVNLILGGIFGASVGLFSSIFILIPFYGFFALIIAIGCLGFGVVFSYYKKYHRHI